MLKVTDLAVSYGAIRALCGISFEIAEGGIVTLIGGNGAGKSTTLRTISGLLRPASGRITFRGHELTQRPAHEIVALGLGHVPEGRMVFSTLTVDENLAMGAYLQTDKVLIAQTRDYVFSIFPRLKERLKQTAGTLSGGEQQMLAIARALMGRPKLLLLDEPSLGLAPLLVKQIFGVIREINARDGVTVFLVEQNAHHALRIAHRGYVMANGRIVLSGTGRELLANAEVRRAYLEGGR